MTTTRFRLAKMDCAAEEQLVRMRLDSVQGVQRVDVDLERRTVTVEYETETAQVAAALDELGLDGTQVVIHENEVVGSRLPIDPAREHQALVLALAVNASFFVGELVVGVAARSLGLIADSLDMAADASIYAISAFAVGRSATRKRQLAAVSGYLQFGLAFAGLIAVARRFAMDVGPPEPGAMIVMAALALVGNVATILIIRRVRSGDAHIQASWIFTANDIKVNLLVIAAAVVVAVTDSASPDLVAGGVIFLIVANGARRILVISRR